MKKIIFILFLIILSYQVLGNNTTNTSLINITLINPKYGGSKVTRFDLIIKTSNFSNCKYTFNPLLNYSEIVTPSNFFYTDDNFIHIIPDFELDLPDNEPKIIYFLCKTNTGYVNDGYPINYTLMIDRTNPKILNAFAEPSLLIEKLKVDLIAETDDLSICRFDLGQPNENDLFNFFNNSNINSFKKIHKLTLTDTTNPQIIDNKNYTFLVTCMNNAEQFAEFSIITFASNLSVPNQIIEVSPLGIVSNKSLEIRVITNRDSICKYGQNYFNYFPQKNKKIHFIQEQNLPEGEHIYPVRCDFDQGKPTLVSTEIKFIILTSSPDKVNINTTNSQCNNTQLNATFTSNSSIGVLGYYYQIINSKNMTITNKEFTTSDYVELHLNLSRNETYYWLVYATNIAGKNGTISKSSGTYILSETDCLAQPPILNISTKLTETGVIINLSCKDIYGNCNIKYSLNSLDCKNTTYLSPFIIKSNSSICVSAINNKNLSTQKTIDIKFTKCIGNISCCGNKQALLCEEHCSPILVECNINLLDSDEDGIFDIKEDECKLDKYNSSDANLDFDEDNLTNKEECLTYKTDLFNKDTDGDGVDDNVEIQKGSNPLDEADYPDDLDSDGDTIPDKKEKQCGLNPNKKDANDDNDEDGLTNKEECLTYNTKIAKTDSDEDGFSDKREIESGTDPNDPESYPKSHFLNIFLIILGIASLGGGIYFFMKSPISLPKSLPKPNYNLKQKIEKPKINFNESKKELKQEDISLKKEILPSHPYEPIEVDPNYLIKRKKEQLKLRKMQSIFDEFVESEEKQEKKEDLVTREHKEIFEELDEIARKRVNKR